MGKAVKVYDCFKFFNELELLELRLSTLNTLVDYFVLVEANKTHTGNPKDFIFEQHKDEFSEYIDKIIYVKVEDLPDYSRDNIWIAENFQRNCIMRGLGKALSGDKIIVSDIDEIPNPCTVERYISSPEPVTMTQHLFYYYINCLQTSPWNGSILATVGNFESPQTLRNMARDLGFNTVSNGGWHYSYMGGAERIKFKVENIAESHVITDKIGSISDINKKMISQDDLWGRTEDMFKKQIVDITEEGMAPMNVDKFIKKYPNFYYGNK
jgi:beta-1,4-mannosyl-glycoprotein beta-1,4-N-acetylglucosaminyltransferase